MIPTFIGSGISTVSDSRSLLGSGPTIETLSYTIVEFKLKPAFIGSGISTVSDSTSLLCSGPAVEALSSCTRDLMNLLTMNVESSEIIAKLNEHYPRWSPQYKSNLQKEFNIENPKVLNYIEASHTQCRRLVLKLAIDQAYKSTYMTDQYSSDVQQIIEESRKYINEVIAALEEISGTSVIEKLLSGEEKLNTANLSHHLLLESLEPNMTESDLLQFLEDFDREDSTQQTSSLASCLLPFGAILSDDSESEGESDSCSGTSGTDSES
ncbi:uncharacterized protein LOC129232553 [Uloborus diversus]|uniref:uncharacterized protein LOC129232553 n=1 Tax=Uloborus diversus TaxID=327109 RepID=UPI0024097D91|nr:uncharacterized protein LOC129232553 [Uloborus diversus]